MFGIVYTVFDRLAKLFARSVWTVPVVFAVHFALVVLVGYVAGLLSGVAGVALTILALVMFFFHTGIMLGAVVEAKHAR